jgi:hypothetical protein
MYDGTPSQVTNWSIDLFCAGERLPDMLFTYLSCLLDCSGLDIASLCNKFTAGIHQWLPVVHKESLVNRVAPSSGGKTDADDLILLLAVYLITVHPSLGQSNPPPYDLRSVYFMVKVCFTKVQMIFSSTFKLVQAGVLISTYEYSSRKLESALVTIETCVVMANLLGLSPASPESTTDQLDDETRVKSFEKRNVSWGILLIERQAYPLQKYDGNAYHIADSSWLKRRIGIA